MPIDRTIIAAARSGALILTANQRLARDLLRRYDLAQQESGAQVWDAPQIISYQGWLNRSLTELGESWRLLGKNQALRLWEGLIEDSCRGTTLELLQIGKTAEKAYEAGQALFEYQLSLEGCFLTDDQQVFKGWFDRFAGACQREQWLDQSQLPARIARAMETGDLPLPRQVLLVGFDQLPPGCELLQRTARSLGGSFAELALAAEAAPRIRVLPVDNADQEILLAARWARQLLDDNAGTIGIVVPDLEARRRKIERVFRDQLDPGAAPALHDEEANFSLSLGAPLLEQGIVHAACELLSVSHQLSLEQASMLLRTPYLAGGQTEADRRARLDRRLRSFKQQQIGLDRLTKLAAETDGLPGFTAICRQMAAAGKDKNLRLPGNWAERFALELQKFGWPGERPLASSEYQAVKAWREKLLPVLASLDQVSQPLGRSAALALLRRLAGGLPFQLEAPTGPLQVVGLLESGGLRFDHLWVMGMSEASLPAPPRPNPFLPYEVQERYGMPHASTARELVFAEQIIVRLQAASPDLVFSYPLRDGESELRPSPLLPKATATGGLRLAAPQDFHSRLRFQLPGLEQFSDQRGPELGRGEGSGGTGILKDQAHCPFRAFAHYRLAARALDTAEPGLDAMTRGDLVHLLLERLWTLLKDQQALLRLSEEEQHSLLLELVERAVEEYFRQRNRPAERLLQLERERLVNLAEDWLNSVERLRAPFRVVEVEQDHEEQIGPLRIRTKIDRVDELAEGRRVVLDYKTGSNLKPEDLVSEPLLEPQLPIYATAASGREADGAAFAQVRRGDCRLLGLVCEAGLLDKVKTVEDYSQAGERGIQNWEQLLADWRRQLEQLAADHVAGEAVVRPFDLQRSCRYCDLPGFCRIAEAVADLGEDA